MPERLQDTMPAHLKHIAITAQALWTATKDKQAPVPQVTGTGSKDGPAPTGKSTRTNIMLLSLIGGAYSRR